MKKVRMLAVLNLLIFVFAFIVSELTQFKLIGNQNMGEVSDKYDSVFTPAGITFAIWGVIYLALFIFTIYHLVQAYKKDIHAEPNQVLQKIGYHFIFNNIATAAWVIAFMYEYILLALVLIIIQLYTLAKIHVELKMFDFTKSITSKICTQIPLSLYFAWICIATLANASAALVYFNFDNLGLAANTYAVALISLAALVGLYFVMVKRNPYFGLVLLWAFYGIQWKRKQIDADVYAPTIHAIWIAFMFIAILILIRLVLNYKAIQAEKKQGAISQN